MTEPPRRSKRTPAASTDEPAPRAARKEESVNTPRAPLRDRLPDMTDYKLRAFQASAMRIGSDPSHPKHQSARAALPLIEAEIKLRATARDVSATAANEDALDE